MKKVWILFALLCALCQTALAEEDQNRILVAYVSRAGENYNVGVKDPASASAAYAGYIEKGNTEIMAEMIAEMTGADLYRITTQEAYPEEYQSMLQRAQEELDQDARPLLAGELPDMARYDTILIGYPIWHAAVPRPVLSFLESYDLAGKTIIPFNTHEGSGQSGTVREIQTSAEGAAFGEGLAVQGKVAQEEEAKTRELVRAWLEELNLLK